MSKRLDKPFPDPKTVALAEGKQAAYAGFHKSSSNVFPQANFDQIKYRFVLTAQSNLFIGYKVLKQFLKGCKLFYLLIREGTLSDSRHLDIIIMQSIIYFYKNVQKCKYRIVV